MLKAAEEVNVWGSNAIKCLPADSQSNMKISMTV